MPKGAVDVIRDHFLCVLGAEISSIVAVGKRRLNDLHDHVHHRALLLAHALRKLLRLVARLLVGWNGQQSHDCMMQLCVLAVKLSEQVAVSFLDTSSKQTHRLD